MKIIVLTVASLACCASLVFVGCNQSRKPDGFPVVYPTMVTVRDGAKPLPNVRLMFYAAPGSTDAASYAVSGTTDAQGVAQIYSMQVEYVAKGAPVGSYTVTVAETIEVEHRLTQEERMKLSPPQSIAYEAERKKQLTEAPRAVPTVLCADMSDPKNRGKERSPLVLEIKSGSNSFEIDVAAYK